MRTWFPAGVEGECEVLCTPWRVWPAWPGLLPPGSGSPPQQKLWSIRSELIHKLPLETPACAPGQRPLILPICCPHCNHAHRGLEAGQDPPQPASIVITLICSNHNGSHGDGSGASTGYQPCAQPAPQPSTALSSRHSAALFCCQRSRSMMLCDLCSSPGSPSAGVWAALRAPGQSPLLVMSMTGCVTQGLETLFPRTQTHGFHEQECSVPGGGRKGFQGVTCHNAPGRAGSQAWEPYG